MTAWANFQTSLVQYLQGRLNVGQELPLLPGQVLDRFGGQVAGDAG